MLSDHDVDGVSATYYERQIRHGKVFVSVDTRIAEGKRATAQHILTDAKGCVRAPSGKEGTLQRSLGVLSEVT